MFLLDFANCKTTSLIFDKTEVKGFATNTCVGSYKCSVVLLTFTPSVNTDSVGAGRIPGITESCCLILLIQLREPMDLGQHSFLVYGKIGIKPRMLDSCCWTLLL